MACNIIKAVWKLKLTPQQKLVLLAYADHASEDGSDAFPGLNRVSEMTGFHRNTVRKYIKELIVLGHMGVQEQRPGRSTIYRLTCTPQSGGVASEPLHPRVDDTPTPQSGYPKSSTPTPQSVQPGVHSRVDDTPTPQSVHEPLSNHQFNHYADGKEPSHQERFGALVDALGIKPLTKPDKSLYGKVVKAFTEAGLNITVYRDYVAHVQSLARKGKWKFSVPSLISNNRLSEYMANPPPPEDDKWVIIDGRRLLKVPTVDIETEGFYLDVLANTPERKNA